MQITSYLKHSLSFDVKSEKVIHHVIVLKSFNKIVSNIQTTDLR